MRRSFVAKICAAPGHPASQNRDRSKNCSVIRGRHCTRPMTRQPPHVARDLRRTSSFRRVLCRRVHRRLHPIFPPSCSNFPQRKARDHPRLSPHIFAPASRFSRLKLPSSALCVRSSTLKVQRSTLIFFKALPSSAWQSAHDTRGSASASSRRAESPRTRRQTTDSISAAGRCSRSSSGGCG